MAYVCQIPKFPAGELPETGDAPELRRHTMVWDATFSTHLSGPFWMVFPGDSLASMDLRSKDLRI
jgi:hypothetical protein